MKKHRLLVSLAATAVTLSALAACGSDDDDAPDTLKGLSGAEVRDAVIDDMDDVDSLHLVADITTDGSRTAMDISLDDDGRCTGTMTLGEVTAEIMSDGKSSFIRGDEDFWSTSSGDPAAGAQTAGLLEGKWARFPAAQLGDMCQLDTLLSGLNEKTDKEVELGKVVDHDGVKALEITTVGDDGEKSYALAAYEGDHHLLQISREGTESGSFALSDFDKSFDVKVPAPAEFVDMETLTD